MGDLSEIKKLLREALSQKVCMKHPVGVVIETANFVQAPKYILGWNGAPSSGVEHVECSRKGFPSGQGMQYCPTVHAEIKAITHAAKEGVAGGLAGATIYLNEWFPCDNCAKAIVESGIKKLVTPDEVYLNKEEKILAPILQKQPYNFELAEKLIREAGIEIVVEKAIKP